MQCPFCDGPSNILGTLGNLEHYRCQDCHYQFIHTLPAPSLIFDITSLKFPIRLFETSTGTYEVTYGTEHHKFCTYDDAAKHLGVSIMHALQSAGTLEP